MSGQTRESDSFEAQSKEGVVGAVIWTYNRYPVLQDALESVSNQHRPPDFVVVVDSDSPDDTVRRVQEDYPDVAVVKLPHNDGVGAAAAVGISEALRRGAEWVWLIEDDSCYPPDCLTRSLATIDRIERAGQAVDMFGWQGMLLRWGIWKTHQPDTEQRVSSVLLDGSLVHRRLVERIGRPRDDFFLMIDDVEYGLRASRSGCAVWVSPAAKGDAGKLGAAESPLWRCYYQTRNHTRLVMDYRSPVLAFGLLARLTHQLALCLRKGSRGRREAALRFRGLWDALARRMGRTLDPASDSFIDRRPAKGGGPPV